MSPHNHRPDYFGVTEVPGTLVSRHAAAMAVSRYELVRKLSGGLKTLEVACGSGQGLRYVAETANCAIGGDIMYSLLERARAADHGASLVQFDAHMLPFASNSFGLVQLHEALYYMQDSRQVIAECRRVLETGGVLVISSVNPEWADFNPSPHAASYYSAAALEAELTKWFSNVEISFGFPVEESGSSQQESRRWRRRSWRFRKPVYR